MIFLVAVFVLFGCVSSEDFHLLSVAPTSINVSEGTLVEFTCQTTFNETDVDIFVIQPSGEMLENRVDKTVLLPGGGIEVMVSFTATAAVNETMVQCVGRNLTNTSDTEITSASLLVQGPPAGVSNLGVEYEDVCCTLITWDDPYTLSGVPITGYSITVNNMSAAPDNMVPNNNTLCLTAPGSYVVTVTALISTMVGLLFGEPSSKIVNLPEVEYNMSLNVSSLQPTSVTLQVVIMTLGQCVDATVDTITLIFQDDTMIVANVTIDAANINEDEVEIMAFTTVNMTLLNEHLQVNGIIVYTNGQPVQTSTSNLSTFDVQIADYFISSVGVVCVECELVPGTQAQGCHVILDCDSGDVIAHDLITSSMIASGCLPTILNTPTVCTISFYDIEEDGSISSDSAVVHSNIVLSGKYTIPDQSQPLPSTTSTTTMTTTTSMPNDTGIVSWVVIVVITVLVIAISIIVVVIGICLHKRVKRKYRRSVSAEQELNAYQLPERSDQQGSHAPMVQYAEMETPASSTTVVLPVGQPVTYSFVDIQRLGVAGAPVVDVMIDHKQLMIFVAPRVSIKWYHMGVALALTPPFLEDIEQNSGGNPERCISDVFQAWREQRSRPYTWESLLIALKAVGVEEMEFARELELQIQGLQQQQTSLPATTSLPVQGEMYSRLQHNSNQSTPSTTPCRHIPTTNYESLPNISNNTIPSTAAASSIEPGLSLDQLIGELTKLKEVASKWKAVGIALALTPPDLETIATRNCQEPTMCMTGVVQLWKYREPRPYTIRTLITIFKSVGEHDLALQLEHYQITTTT